MKKILKKANGITLLTLSIYIGVIIIIIGVLASIRTFFFKNVDSIQNMARYAESFDNFNSAFLKDVKNNRNVILDGNNIIFSDGTTYYYNVKDNSIYKQSIKIATNVVKFSATTKTEIVNGTNKDIITINIEIGDLTSTIFSKTIDYTLKYW